MSGSTHRPLVSVIIPNFNHAAFLGAAIESVLDQQYEPIELIVVDDGSTDASRAVAARYGTRLRYIYQDNRGLSAARNRGIADARGDLVAVLDADDEYEPEFAAELVALLQAAPTAGAAYCGYRFVDGDSRPLPQVDAQRPVRGRLYDRLVEGNFLVAESMLVRRTTYEAVGTFDESLRACEDWDMWLRIAARYEIVGTARALVRYRMLAGSMSSDPARMAQNRLAVIQKRFADDEPRRRRATAHAYQAAVSEYLQFGEEETAGAYLVKLAAIAPELLDKRPLFYELACGDQPKGWRGELATLDLDAAERRLYRLLSRVAAERRLPLRPLLASAHVTLAWLRYGRGQNAAAGRDMLRALRLQPALILDPHVLALVPRTVIPPRTRASMRRARAWVHSRRPRGAR